MATTYYPGSMGQPHRAATVPTIARFHLDLGSLDLVHEDLLIRRRLIAVARPAPRDVERLAGIAARLDREGGR